MNRLPRDDAPVPERPAGVFFAPGGPLSRAHPAYEHRPGQQRMADAVEATLRDGGVSMVEAGTGTGKTLAYLVPAVASGRRVIVSTGTRNLQDQIYHHDLPFLREKLELPVSACLMKGRDNYLCRYRLAEFLREPRFEDLSERRWLDVIAGWSETTRRGDRAEIAELPDRLRLWRDVNARADTCTGQRCPEYERCWLTRMKQAGQQAQIVVVNHHLFFADLAVRTAYGSVLPDYDTVIFDEAHLIEEVATLYFGSTVSAAQVEDLARDAERLAAGRGGAAIGGGGAAGLRLAARDFFEPLLHRVPREAGRVRFEPVERGGPDLRDEWTALAESLEALAAGAGARPAAGDASEAVERRAEGMLEALERILARDDPAFVYGLELRGRANVVLSAAPIDVAELLHERLFERLDATVLTSATLTVGSTFDFFRRRLGLREAEELSVGSPFDHGEQALLYLPKRMPEPREAGFIERAVEEIVALLEITGGRAFLLFTSYANMLRVRDELESRDRWPLFVQGEGSKVALVESFRGTERAVLLGTSSFWHGVDVPGEALSAVIVDKLPYDVPSDPLVAARIDHIRRQGGNPFMDYQTPMAVLELKQGLGRLLRSREDRGLLSVLDPRLTTRRYGKVFLQSLPGYRIVRELQACRDFFDAAGR